MTTSMETGGRLWRRKLTDGQAPKCAAIPADDGSTRQSVCPAGGGGWCPEYWSPAKPLPPSRAERAPPDGNTLSDVTAVVVEVDANDFAHKVPTKTYISMCIGGERAQRGLSDVTRINGWKGLVCCDFWRGCEEGDGGIYFLEPLYHGLDLRWPSPELEGGVCANIIISTCGESSIST